MILQRLLAVAGLIVAAGGWVEAQADEADVPPQPFLANGSFAAYTGSGVVAGERRQNRHPDGLPLRATREIRFSTDEGTWMSLDVTPDGRRIVFDLLGDLYVMDAGGGRARALTRGLALDTQPTISPDGRWIAFVSDRSGAENLWRMRLDGSGLEQISFGDDDSTLTSPAWSADGRSLYVSRFLWSLDNYELWRIDLDGRQTLIDAVKPADVPRASGHSSLGAVASADGRYLYYARRQGTSEDSVPEHWTVVRRDLGSGTLTTVVDAPGEASFRPQLSPDGRWLAYARRDGGQTGLRLRELSSGNDRSLAFPVEHDQIQAQSWMGLLPRYAFTPDSRAIVLSRNGHFERLPLQGQAGAAIPFSADVRVALGPQTRVQIPEPTGAVTARLMQDPQISPDGTQAVYTALGRLYLQSLAAPAATPVALTAPGRMFAHPAWSPDGRSIVCVSWDDLAGGQIWIVPAAGGEPRPFSAGGDYYTHPVFTPDGGSLLVLRSPRLERLQRRMEFGSIREDDLLRYPLHGGDPVLVAHGSFGGMPHFGPDADAVLLLDRDGLVSVDLRSGAVGKPRDVRGPGWYFREGPSPVDDARLSPDGKWLLVRIVQQLHLIEAPAPGESVDLTDPQRRHRRITEVGADFMQWSADGKSVIWSLGHHLYRRSLASITLNPAQQPDWRADAPGIGQNTETWNAEVRVPRDVARGNLLLSNVRAVTMRGDECIEHADILISDGHIAAIGTLGSLAVPPATTRLDLSGKTIIPGLVDVHDHASDIRRDVLSDQSWGYRARLAWGITTSFDPSTLSIDRFAYQDMVDAGAMLGPRLPSTGMALFSYNRLASLEDARALVRRYRDFYGTRNLKQYLIGDREQRQWLIQAAGQEGLMPTTEGSLSFKLMLSQLLDGYAANEHAWPTPLYRDMITLIARSGTGADGTLQIKNGGPPAQDDFVARFQPLSDPEFLRSRPHAVALDEARSRDWVDPSLMLYPRIAHDLGEIQKAGGIVAAGSHGEIPGPGMHWELLAYTQGGMTPLQALRAGTLGGAEHIGRAAWLGSLEPGKVADLLILDANPLDDIRNTQKINAVMKAGRLYDPATLAERWPQPRPAPAQWFDGEVPDAR